MKKPCIILTGPTAVGKTKLSIQLAKALNGAIVSADCMQVYRQLDIGSAKVTPEEMEGIPHYLIDCMDPREDFDVARFQSMAKAAMEEIYAQGKLPIITGGTGFYIQALLKDVDFSESSGESLIRRRLQEEFAQKGPAALHDRLRQVDPKAAEEIHPNNTKRVIRALEFFEETGKPISDHNHEQKEKESPYTCCYFVLNDDRSLLYERINKRVDLMIEAGLVEEVRGLMEQGLDESYLSMKGIGYKELFPYLRGDMPLDACIETIKMESRRYAKRQLTWFRREKDVIWVNKQDFAYDEDKILAFMLDTWKNKCKLT
ncbi:MAG: tRNA (adenosine(37)-N6)-dimethylallyltransferase MiaA [Lachnospiraceae bacterium]|nr:tRNA (adenosine(37)-N6)-dimethylallyltransferase MiaA [Lachnospiraceae bacterium]